MNDKVEKEIMMKAIEGRLTCHIARKIAEDLNVTYETIGRTADKLKVKITNCQLGCFK